MRYEISWGGGSLFVLAASEAEALRKFAEEWTQYGDELPAAYWVSARWSCS